MPSSPYVSRLRMSASYFQTILLAAIIVTCGTWTLTCPPSQAVIEKADLQDGELWITNSGKQPLQVTKDGKPKSAVLISPNKQLVLYFIQSSEGKNLSKVVVTKVVVTKVVVRNEHGDQVLEFRPRSKDDYCNSINHLEWIDDGRIGIDCHCNPSLSLYLDVDKSTGKTRSEYYGYGFSWSPDRKTLAHVGAMIHFAKWPHSEYIQLNNQRVYPKGGAVYGNDKLPVHTFGEFVWSPDSRKVAVLDNLSGSAKGTQLVVISNGKPTRRLIKTVPGTGDFKLNRKDNDTIMVSSESGNKAFDVRMSRATYY